MAGINKVIIVGNLGQDVETKTTQDGQSIARFSIATSENWTDRNTGQKQEKTEWHRIVIFGKLADIASQYLHKGSKVYVEGKLRTQKWQDQQGNDRYTTEIVISGFGGTLQMLDSKGSNNDTSHHSNAPAPQAPSAKNEPNANVVTPLAQPDDFEDDIPF